MQQVLATEGIFATSHGMSIGNPKYLKILWKEEHK